MVRSMAAGVIDAGAGVNELDARAAALGLTLVTTSDEVSPLAIRRCFITTTDVLKEKHDQVVHFLAAGTAGLWLRAVASRMRSSPSPGRSATCRPARRSPRRRSMMW